MHNQFYVNYKIDLSSIKQKFLDIKMKNFEKDYKKNSDKINVGKIKILAVMEEDMRRMDEAEK